VEANASIAQHREQMKQDANSTESGEEHHARFASYQPGKRAHRYLLMRMRPCLLRTQCTARAVPAWRILAVHVAKRRKMKDLRVESIVMVQRRRITGESSSANRSVFLPTDRHSSPVIQQPGFEVVAPPRDRQCGREGDGMPRCLHHGFRTNRPGFVAMTSVL
jgi:hypothetical protein